MFLEPDEKYWVNPILLPLPYPRKCHIHNNCRSWNEIWTRQNVFLMQSLRLSHRVNASSLSSHGWSPLGPVALYGSRLLKKHLTSFSSTAGHYPKTLQLSIKVCKTLLMTEQRRWIPQPYLCLLSLSHSPIQHWAYSLFSFNQIVLPFVCIQKVVSGATSVFC